MPCSKFTTTHLCFILQLHLNYKIQPVNPVSYEFILVLKSLSKIYNYGKTSGHVYKGIYICTKYCAHKPEVRQNVSK